MRFLPSDIMAAMAIADAPVLIQYDVGRHLYDMLPNPPAPRLDDRCAPIPERRDAAERKRRGRQRAMGRTHSRGDKLGRRLRRKFELGRAGAF